MKIEFSGRRGGSGGENGRERHGEEEKRGGNAQEKPQGRASARALI